MHPGERDVSLAHVLDAMEQGVIVYDAAGKVAYANVAMDELFASEPEPARLRDALHEVSRVLSAADGNGDHGAPELVDAARVMTVMLRTTATEYRLRGSTLQHGSIGCTGGVVVTVHARAGARYWTPDDLREQHGLTPTEARVAALLEAGLPSREIARALEISVHTARRHAEAVLRKLGVHSRRAVRAKLARE
jgi:DNA-binding CsgD family transcriptional regulator